MLSREGPRRRDRSRMRGGERPGDRLDGRLEGPAIVVRIRSSAGSRPDGDGDAGGPAAGLHRE